MNLDVGLIELLDANEWTTRYVELGEVGPVADLNELNITVRLIDAPLVAIGAASGRREGRIKALFYRFKSVGGYDYVSDFLISPRGLDQTGSARSSRRTAKPPQTLPGDSGAVWHLVTRPDNKPPRSEDEEFQGTLRPLAIQWGGQVFLEGNSLERKCCKAGEQGAGRA